MAQGRRPGQSAGAGRGGEPLHGSVTRNATCTDPRSRTLRTEIDFPNPQGKLLPGMYVQAAFFVQHVNAWTLPAAAIITEGNQSVCYRVQNAKAIRTPLQIGLKGGGLVEDFMLQMPAESPSVEGHWTPITGQEEVVVSIRLAGKWAIYTQSKSRRWLTPQLLRAVDRRSSWAGARIARFRRTTLPILPKVMFGQALASEKRYRWLEGP